MDLEFLQGEAESWAFTHGLMMRQADGRIDHAPFSLVPAKVNRIAYEHVKSLGTLFNRLVDRCSRDFDFIQQSLKEVVKADDFTRRLLEIYTTVHQEGITQPLTLGIHRSDYLPHHTPQADADGKEASDHIQYLQVEINTISSAFAALSTQIAGLHRFLAERHGAGDVSQLPVNQPVVHVAHALAKAVAASPTPQGCVMMVVQPGERNSADQRLLEYTLFQNHGVKLIRRSFADVSSRAQLQPHKTLTIDGYEVGVVYYRAGYTPNDYLDESSWEARLTLERCSAVKCPSIAYHLAGCKKIQQVLAFPNVLERFVSAEDAQQLRSCFAGLWSLDETEESARVVAAALQNPDDYVLKPQREGGGNNLYGEELKTALSSMSMQERAGFILMQKIRAEPQPGLLIKGSKLWSTSVVSELGIFSTYLGDGVNAPLVDEVAGHLLRTKPVDVNEGGVAAGFAVLDSPCLV
eukprot:TRINITY_DN6562_c0_g2_i2.p1 TRINITY_DN6562_c0_g2~~TRINITY_DN6562_c0_g2_i2.p1  ORF type:complete len:465 (-),score=160.47 TRINITY_DN6562_c0_g2_i2:99-1493(-)